MWLTDSKRALIGGGSSGRYWRMKQAQLAERHKSSREAENTYVACWTDCKKLHQSSEKSLAMRHGEGGAFYGFSGVCTLQRWLLLLRLSGNANSMSREHNRCLKGESGSAGAWQGDGRFFSGEVSTQEKLNYCRIAFNDQGEQSGDQACDSHTS